MSEKPTRNVPVSNGPLADVLVVDLTQMLAGPYATMLLADLGADVVKVEPPHGDMTRQNQPHLEEDEAYGGYFHSVNRNKRSVAVDLKSAEGREAFLDLVSNADVVIENFRSGTMEKLDLSYETLSERNPRLVYASIRGFGDPRGGESPHADRPAFDLIAQAMGGVMSITGTEEAGPTKVGPGVGDIFPATLAVVGVLSALRERDRTGEGQYVDVGMVDAVLSLSERIVHQHSFTDDIPGPQGNTHPLLFPFDRFETDDGYVVIAAPSAHQWRSLCDHMDRPDLADEYAEKLDRIESADELREIVTEWTKRHTKDELFEMLADDVPCGPVNDAEDIFEDEHFQARKMLPEVDHADTGETATIAGTPIKFPESNSGVERRAPFLGEHTEEILREQGFSDDEIDDLLDEGVYGTIE
ncbi:succinate--mesaconate CoA-transferase [Natronorubrum sediminis]|uniref:Succinate--mesaconate CoA-transferase n=1 Tax=Natronorubrum sediminis TaxID=640943 RepID=A0A1H6G412_9EURY|nr:CoA transferase [Natronorubrum sediminis]SEH17827.1 succinate--mesaconate CoA-transferase [Natronorubrum sediminis]